MRPTRIAAVALVAGSLLTTADAATGPSLRVSPTTVHRGDNLTVSGIRWGAYKKITFLVGLPNSEATSRVGTTTTNKFGSFTGTVPVLRTATPGTYVFLACRKSCAIKRSKVVHIVK